MPKAKTKNTAKRRNRPMKRGFATEHAVRIIVLATSRTVRCAGIEMARLVERGEKKTGDEWSEWFKFRVAQIERGEGPATVHDLTHPSEVKRQIGSNVLYKHGIVVLK